AYARFCRLLTLGRRRADKGECTLALADLLEHGEGLLAGLVPSDGPFLKTVNAIHPLRDALGERLSLVISRVYGGDDEMRIRNLSSLSRRFNVPLLASNAVHYHEPARRRLQDVLTCIRHQCAIQQAGFKLFPNCARYRESPAR